MKKYFLVVLLSLFMQTTRVAAAPWQWSVEIKELISEETNAHPSAYLWIPENCNQVRAVIIGQHNMTEETIFEHPEFRKNMGKLGIAEIWITPGIDQRWDVTKGTRQIFETMMKNLSEISGYAELEFAPVIPIGHSAMATYPWNFAAWNPERTLAVLSIHGDSPRTHLTGLRACEFGLGNPYD